MTDVIDAVRRFNRFYTRHVGAMDARFLDTDANLAEARLLFEIAMREPVEATMLGAVLDFDRGYLSRLVATFEKKGWIVRDRDRRDGRVRPIRLTASGRATFDTIDRRQRAAVSADLDRLDAIEQADLAEALAHARLLLDPTSGGDPVIRPFRTGDVGRIAARQSILYAASHGWGRGLETVEVETVAAFLRGFKPGREQCWVAEMDGVMAGAVFVTDEGGGVARLRLLHVEPFARRRGIGDALVSTCIAFARGIGQAEIMLWTQAVLGGARRIYARHGFSCVERAVHDHFGTPVDGETWRLRLA